MTEQNDIVEEVSTHDLTLAAVLNTTGHIVDHVTLTGRNKTLGVFHFKNVSKRTVQQFEQGSLRVDPTVFHMNIRRLMSMVTTVVKNENVNV